MGRASRAKRERKAARVRERFLRPPAVAPLLGMDGQPKGQVFVDESGRAIVVPARRK